MPVFVYKAANRRGQTVDGVMEAADARAVVERLHKEAYYPIRVSPHGERAGLFTFGGSSRIDGGGDALAEVEHALIVRVECECARGRLIERTRCEVAFGVRQRLFDGAFPFVRCCLPANKNAVPAVVVIGF